MRYTLIVVIAFLGGCEGCAAEHGSCPPICAPPISTSSDAHIPDAGMYGDSSVDAEIISDGNTSDGNITDASYDAWIPRDPYPGIPPFVDAGLDND